MEQTFYNAMSGFMIELNKLDTDNTAANGYRGRSRVFTEDSGGTKYVRVVAVEINTGSRSAYCFVSRADGRIYKPAGWKGPEKNFSRGCIFDEEGRLAWCGVHGIQTGQRV